MPVRNHAAAERGDVALDDMAMWRSTIKKALAVVAMRDTIDAPFDDLKRTCPEVGRPS
jgi:hypothetical protein